MLFIGGAEEVTGPIVVAEEALLGKLVELGTRLYCVYLKWNSQELLSPLGIGDQLSARGKDLLREFCAANPAGLWMSVSSDGGRTWDSPFLLTKIEIPSQVETLDSQGVASFITKGLEAPLFPSGAVDPSTDTIYIAYPSASAGKKSRFS